MRLLWESMMRMFSLDHAAGRAMMRMRGVYVWSHKTRFGEAPYEKLFEQVRVRNVGPRFPRSFDDYRIEVSDFPQNDHITFTRNPDWFDAPRPYLDEITFRLVPDTETRFESVRAGEVQLGQSTNGAEIAEAAETDGMQGFPANGPGITIMMNTSQPPFDDPRVRMAILQATDREALRAARTARRNAS